jgi:CBS domain-containing protein
MPQTAAAIKGVRQSCDGAGNGLVSDQLRRHIVERGRERRIRVRVEGLMRVADVLKSNRQSLATCIPEESITSICTRLSALNIGAFPVCDAHGALVGIISERDVVRAFAKDGARLADMHVRDLMTREVTTCTQETSMVEAEKLMNKHRVRHLPITEGGKLVGMLSIRDVMVWRQQEARDEANILREAMIAVRNR